MRWIGLRNDRIDENVDIDDHPDPAVAGQVSAVSDEAGSAYAAPPLDAGLPS
jgi:hypothetical protein